MPKEMVRSQYNYSEPRTSDDKTPLVRLGVHVGWTKAERYVDGMGAPVEISCELIYADHTTRDGGPSVPLSRSDLNNLIRVLRKARDQAYGRDE